MLIQEILPYIIKNKKKYKKPSKIPKDFNTGNTTIIQNLNYKYFSVIPLCMFCYMPIYSDNYDISFSGN